VSLVHRLLGNGLLMQALEESSVCPPRLAGWLDLIQAEYKEIPGLHLTKPQIQRLWGLDAVTCDALIDALVDARFLRRTARDAYARAEGSR